MNESKRNIDSQLESMIYKLEIINNEIERLEMIIYRETKRLHMSRILYSTIIIPEIKECINHKKNKRKILEFNIEIIENELKRMNFMFDIP
jgi:hypothetical protein